MRYLILILFPLITISNLKGQITEGQSAQSIDEEKIKKTLTDFIDAWNKHDAKAFSNVFTEDADFVNVAGKGASGRDAIEKHHEPGFKTKWKDSHQEITQSKIRFIKPDVAAVDAWWILTGIKGPEGQDMPTRKGLLNFIMTKNNDIWAIAVMHNTEIVSK